MNLLFVLTSTDNLASSVNTVSYERAKILITKCDVQVYERNYSLLRKLQLSDQYCIRLKP